MSISNLFEPNNYDIYCNDLECNNLVFNDVTCNNINCNNLVSTNIESTSEIKGTQWNGGGDTFAGIDNTGVLIRKSDVADNQFTIFDNADSTKRLQIDVSNVPVATTFNPGIQYTSGNSKIAIADDTINTNVGFTTNPWSTPQSTSYKLQKIGDLVFLWMGGIIASIGVPNSALTNVFIPVDWRPSINTSNTISGRNTGSNIATVTVTVLTTGQINFNVNNGSAFGNAGQTAGFAGFSMFWFV